MDLSGQHIIGLAAQNRSKKTSVNNFYFSHVIDRSKPRWWKVARAVFVKWCIWEIPRTRRVLSRNPIKVEHMKTYSNLTMPNSSPNDEWREHFQTRELVALTLLRQIWINLFFICRITGTTHSKPSDFDKKNMERTCSEIVFLTYKFSLHRLPCKVDRLEGFVMLWKKDSNIITVGTQIIDTVRTHTNANTKGQTQTHSRRENNQ